MGSLQDAVNAPVTLTLADGQEYQLTRIGLTEMCEFSTWINNQEGNKASALVTFQKFGDWMQSPAGIRWLLWRALKTNHPQFKMQADVGPLFSSLGAMRDALDAIVDMSTGDGESGGDGEAADPPQSTGARSAE